MTSIQFKELEHNEFGRRANVGFTAHLGSEMRKRLRCADVFT
jgi:hypothetical protein